MKAIGLLFFAAMFACAVAAQSYHHIGTYDFGDKILGQKLITGGRELVLVGENRSKIWDLEQRKAIVEGKLDTAKNPAIDFGAMSPDGGRILDKGRVSYLSKNGYLYYRPGPAAESFVLDTKTGERLAKLDRTTACGFWSRGGDVLVTMSKDICVSHVVMSEKDVEISFWDGRTFEFRASVTLLKPAMIHLSPDGQALYTTSWPKGPNLRERIDVWDTRKGGGPSPPLSTEGTGYSFYPGAPKTSPTGDLIAAIGRGTNQRDRALLLWKTGDSPASLAVVKPGVEITSFDLQFSPDEKYIAIDSHETVRVMETASGRQAYEVRKKRVPDLWVANNSVFLYYSLDQLSGVSMATGSQLFEKRLVYESHSMEIGGNTVEYFGDMTHAKPSPRGDMVLTFSNKHLSVFRASDGFSVPSPIRVPPLERSKLGKILDSLGNNPSSGQFFRDAGWMGDDILYVIGGDGRSMSLWKMDR